MVHLFICKGCVICRDGQTEGALLTTTFQVLFLVMVVRSYKWMVAGVLENV